MGITEKSLKETFQTVHQLAESTAMVLTFSLLLIIFSNSLDPDQDQQNLSHDLDPNFIILID